MTTFLRLLHASVDQKRSELAEAAARWRSGMSVAQSFDVAATTFELVPGSPFAYWVRTEVRQLFRNCPGLQTDDRAALSGASTNDNDRFIRASWEPDGASISGPGNPDRKWQPLAKGGEFSRYYADVHLLISWANEGAEVKEFTAARRDSKGWGRHWAAELHNASEYFRPGLTWSLRSNRGLSFRALPSGLIFGSKGPAVMVAGDSLEPLLALLAVLNSACFEALPDSIRPSVPMR